MEQDFKDFMFVFLPANIVLRRCAGLGWYRLLFSEEEEWCSYYQQLDLDPDKNIFPIAYAMVERQTKYSWIWFLQLLDNDIGFEDQHAWTFISDKQKGLIPSFEHLFPNIENKLCVRHLHSNMKHDGFRCVSVKNALWAAARATRVEAFKTRMEELKTVMLFQRR